MNAGPNEGGMFLRVTLNEKAEIALFQGGGVVEETNRSKNRCLLAGKKTGQRAS